MKGALVLAVAGAAAVAEAACPGAFMGVKGGQYDIDGYDPSGFDVFGFNRNGVDRWNRPCSDPNAGLTPAGGRFISEPAVPTTEAGSEDSGSAEEVGSGSEDAGSEDSGSDSGSDSETSEDGGDEGVTIDLSEAAAPEPEVFYEVYPAHINYGMASERARPATSH
jgi:hypothetical protein